jgi:Domain of unknown function (DUF1707)
MPTDDAIRASDADREHAVGMLRDGFAAGRLTLAEFDERTTAAFTSRTWGELRELTKDLPMPGQRGFLPPAPVVPRPRPSEQLPAGAHHHYGGAGLMPVVALGLFWVMLTISARGDGLLIPVVFLLLMVVRSAARFRSGPGSRTRRPPGPPAQPDERPGQAP